MPAVSPNERPRAAGVEQPLMSAAERSHMITAEQPLAQPGVPPIAPEVPTVAPVPVALPASYSASSTLSELFTPESR